MPLVPFVIAALTKATVYSLCQSVHVEGLEHLLSALASGKGVLTVSNHISVLDDPCALSAAMPLRTFLNAGTTRWTLGASDICFKNPVQGAFFRKGQVIETFRSSADPKKAGIYQDAIDEAIQKLDQGKWLHVFPEAKVHQAPDKALLRFRWGVARVLMETKNDFEILPIWLQGFDDLMPLERDFPRFIPRFWRTRIRIVIGAPITHRIQPVIAEYREKAGGPVPMVPLGIEARPKPPRYEGDSEAAKAARIEIAARLREEVERLGRTQQPKMSEIA